MDLEDRGFEETVREKSRTDLYNYIKQSSGRLLDDKFAYMEDCVIRETNCPTEKISSLKKELKLFKWQFRQKWTAASYKEERFLQNNAKWLTGTIKLSAWVKQKTGRPRPSKEFGELSDRSKRRKTKELRAQVPDATLTYAAQMSLRAAGKSDASAIIKEITKSPTRAYKIRKVITQNKEKNIQRLSTMEALSMFVEAGLSRSQYNVIRSARKQLYPCYSLLQKAKADCYPKPESFHVTDTCAEIKLQDLVDHTASRLCTYLEEVLKGLSSEEKENLKLISKWGCDGSQQTRYMQSLQNTNESYDDANIFQSSFLPLRLLLSRASLGFELLLAMKQHARRIFIISLQHSNAVVSISVTNFVMVARPPSVDNKDIDAVPLMIETSHLTYHEI
ncbi:hypothetical protein EVAR_45482_1 [Eumeta japonica]|uniref:Uncharacterized protein n=2 Tax=Ditrysia TaxID=37567 RepID=A0A4C1WDN3_EUMVA|nr:hypothetical protein EVAR_45482_1 [Eumeta japonica]